MTFGPPRPQLESVVGSATIEMPMLGANTSLGADWFDPGYSFVLLGVILLAGVGTTILFFGSLVAYRRRRTTKYLCITLALGLLVVRTIVGFGTLSGIVPMLLHHLIGHSIDFSIAVLILYTVYATGSPRRSESPTSGFDD